MANKSSAKKISHWQRLLGRWRQSGDSAAAFCRAHGLNLNTFYAWRRRLRGVRAKSAVSQKFAPVRVVHMPAVASAPVLELALRCGRVLKAPSDIAPERLAALAQALEARPC
jgi:putative transposase